MINCDDFIELEDDFVEISSETVEGEQFKDRTARWRLESLLEEKRLQEELDDFLDY